MPNQDLINAALLIARHTGNVPITVYDHYDVGEYPLEDAKLIPNWVPATLRSTPEVKEYAYRAKNILRHSAYQARGRPSGVHGLLHQYVRSP